MEENQGHLGVVFGLSVELLFWHEMRHGRGLVLVILVKTNTDLLHCIMLKYIFFKLVVFFLLIFFLLTFINKASFYFLVLLNSVFILCFICRDA